MPPVKVQSALLRLNDVYKVFNEGSVDEKMALQSINLTLEEGDFVTVIGSCEASEHAAEDELSNFFRRLVSF